MAESDPTKPEGDHPSSEKLGDPGGTADSSDAPLVDNALAAIRNKRARQAAAVGTGRARQAKDDD